MKNALLFLFCLSVVGLTSCAKDDLESQTEFEALVQRTSVTVNVSHQLWSDEPADAIGCHMSGLSFILFLEDAAVSIFKKEDGGVDDSGFQRTTGLTNRSGSITFADLEPGVYTIVVISSEHGEKSRDIQVYENVESLVTFRF